MSIARNTFYYSGALVYQKILGFIYFAVIARGLGVENTGLYVFALSFTTLFSVLADIGFAPVLTREIAKDRDSTQRLFSQVFTVKILISLLTYGLVIFFVNMLGYPSLTKTLVYIAGVIMVLDSFSLIFWSVFRGHQNLRFEASGVILHQTITVALGLIAFYSGLGIVWILSAMVAASLFYNIYSLLLLKRKLSIRFNLVFNGEVVKWFLKTAMPFALAGIFSRIYTQIDTVMLSKMGCSAQIICDQNVGWYGIASKVTLALQFIPLALAASLFPAFSRQFTHAPQALAKTYSEAWRYLLIIVIPLSFTVILFAPDIIRIVWGREFIAAAAPMRILMVSLIFLFLTFPNGSLLNAMGRQLTNTIYMGIAVLVNVGLNIWLIIKWNMVGAAIASVISTFILFLLGFITCSMLIKMKSHKFVILFLKITGVAGLMGLTMFNIKGYVGMPAAIVIGVIIYVVITYLLGEISNSDLRLIGSIFNKDLKKLD